MPEFDEEGHYYKDARKIGRQERKSASARDRSKYKKTDQIKTQQKLDLQHQAKLAKEHLLRGRVLSIVPQGIVVQYQDRTFMCSLRGALKKERTHLKNLVTVGDWILFELNPDGEAQIDYVEPRRSILSRADNLSRRKEQPIASNIDQVLITVSVVSPALKPSLVDRYIIAACKGDMEPIIVVNKIDLLQESSLDAELLANEVSLYEQFLEAYVKAEIPVISVSTATGQGMDKLREAMKDKTSVFSGQSGVGKSSLINAITGLDLRIGDIVEKTKKGAHTTTSASLIPLEFGGWCIDTPGIKSFGVWDLKAEEIVSYFSEINTLGRMCKYPDCSHIREEECAVLNALAAGQISQMRYESYKSLIETVSKDHVRR